jgi:hypothetical protein
MPQYAHPNAYRLYRIKQLLLHLAVKIEALQPYKGNTMSAPAPHTETHSNDPVQDIVPLMPVVLPIVGAVLMFLLAFIAVFMA